jgi:hypothetical protein
MMAMDPRELKQLLANAQIKLTGASESGIKAELYDVLKEFFEDSSCWQEDIPFLPLADQTEYLLAPAHEGQIIRLLGVWDDKGSPRSDAFMRDFATLTLVNAPQNDATEPFTARVIKTVTLPITKDAIPVAPDWTLRVYSIHVLDGLLGKMMGQQQKTYSNNSLSAYHLKRFRTGIQIAKVAAERANLVGAQNWMYPQNWRTRSQRGGVSTAYPTRFW